MFALDRTKVVNALAIPVFVLHVAITALGGALFGANGVVGAFFIVPMIFAVVLLVVGAGRGAGPIARELAGDGLRFAFFAAACFGIGAAIGTAVGTGVETPLLTVGIGSILYGAVAAVRLAPDQMRLLIGAVRPASA
jgi:hypothetical protein